MAKTAFSWARLLAIVRAAFGVAVAGAAVIGAVWIGDTIRRRIRGGGGGNNPGSGSASEVKRTNQEAIANLDRALDILRRARDRSNP